MSEDQEPPTSLPPAMKVIITLIVLTVIIVPTLILAQWWLYYSSTVLLWDFQQTAVVTYAGLAVIIAGMIVMAMLRLNKSADPTRSRKLMALITDWTGWVVLLVAFSFSESKDILHVSRHVYFPMALLGMLILGATHVWRYKMSQDKTSVIAALVVAVCFLATGYRYLSGLEKLTF